MNWIQTEHIKKEDIVLDKNVDSKRGLCLNWIRWLEEYCDWNRKLWLDMIWYVDFEKYVD